jgi:Phosphatidylinositol-4-phosphate 5-Kinase
MEVRISIPDYEELINMIQNDSDFLSDCSIIDYSLLVGIHDRYNLYDNIFVENGLPKLAD